MTLEEIRERVALRESDPLSLRPSHVEASWGEDRKNTLPSTTALAFIKAAHGEPCDCVHCTCGR